MYWQEDPDPADTNTDAVVDVLFALDCRALPVDHAHALSEALLGCAPWLAEPGCGLHTVHVAGSQNGWERPAHGVDQQLLLSRRTRLAIRVPAERVAALTTALQGQQLVVGGCPLKIGAGKPKRLSPDATLLARYVVAPTDQAGTDANSEDAFLTWAAASLRDLGLRVRKALCGKVTAVATPDGSLTTRSLLLADLTPDESLLLQQHGLGPGRAMGCGIFIPHKGIEAVGKGRG